MYIRLSFLSVRFSGNWRRLFVLGFVTSGTVCVGPTDKCVPVVVVPRSCSCVLHALGNELRDLWT